MKRDEIEKSMPESLGGKEAHLAVQHLDGRTIFGLRQRQPQQHSLGVIDVVPLCLVSRYLFLDVLLYAVSSILMCVYDHDNLFLKTQIHLHSGAWRSGFVHNRYDKAGSGIK